MSDILIGTSGYDYPEWKGVFYPTDLKRKEFLEYYATKFNALEINSTFYSMPDDMKMRHFYDRTEGKLQFAVKANRTLTHEIDSSWKTRAEEMKTGVMPLNLHGVLSSILFQLPQSFHYTAENRFYLRALLKEFEGFPKVVEFRHREWIKESVFEGLEKAGAGVVFCDMPQLSALPDGTACRTPFVGKEAYIRMHGRNGSAWYVHDSAQNGSARYDYEYSEGELESFCPVIKTALAEGRRVQMFFNNHPGGSGARNAVQMKEILEKGGVV